MVSASCSTTSTVLPISRKLRQRFEQPFVIARMQADGRLVQHVQHAAQLRADLRRQPDALRFAARKRGGRALQAQVVQAHGREELQPPPDLVQHAAGDLRLAVVELPVAHRHQRARHRQLRELRNGEVLHAHRQARRPQALAVARRALAPATCTPSAIRGSPPVGPRSSRSNRCRAPPPAAASRDFCGKSSNGVFRLIRFCRAVSRMLLLHDTSSRRPARGRRRAAASMGSAITLAGSKAHLLPSPWHSSQAPYGLLNENERGSSCGMLVPHSVHASFCE